MTQRVRFSILCIGGPLHGMHASTASKRTLVHRVVGELGGYVAHRYRVVVTSDGRVVGLYAGSTCPRTKR